MLRAGGRSEDGGPGTAAAAVGVAGDVGTAVEEAGAFSGEDLMRTVQAALETSPAAPADPRDDRKQRKVSA